MLSESVHSIADCSNEIVLMVGGRFSKRKTDGDHPFGLYRAKYLASFVVATLLFFVGGFFSTSEAVKKLVAISADPRAASVEINRKPLTFLLETTIKLPFASKPAEQSHFIYPKRRCGRLRNRIYDRFLFFL